MSTKTLLILSLFTLFYNGIPKHLQNRMDKVIKKTYEVESFELKEKLFDAIVISALDAQFNNNNFFELYFNEELQGYTYLSKAPSKTDQFDYLVLFNTDLEIVKTSVLIYREDYGGEIGSKRWLQQFTTKSVEDSFKVGQSIDAISGATISVNSMTHAMDNLMQSLKTLKAKQLL